MGLTALMVEYHKLDGEAKTELFNRVKSVMMYHWVLSNGTICGVSLSANMLAHYLNCDPAEIQLYMRDKLMNTRIWDKEVQENMLNSLIGQQIVWSLEDRMDVQAQVDLLKVSQGSSYKAFISSELNKALKLKLDSTASIQNLVRSISGGNINIFAPIQNNINNTQNNVGVTTEEALGIITAKMDEIQASTRDSDIAYLEAKYDFSNTDEYPEVIASSQVGKGDKEGLKLINKELNMVVDNYKIHRTEEADNDHHQLRREIEDNIEPDDWDPELDEYEDVEDE